MTQPNILELAKQGDARAITSLLNRSLQPKGITAKAAKRDDILHVLLEGETPPNQTASIRCIYQGLQKLGFVDTPITIYGREQGSAEVCWQSHIDAPLVGEPPVMADSEAEMSGADDAVSNLPAPPPPPPTDSLGADVDEGGETWDDFDFRSAGNDEPTAISDSPTPMDEPASYEASAQAWNNDFAGDDFALDSPDEPTLIVPPQPDEDLDSSGMSDEDSDSEILLSLWDDADIDEDDMVEPSIDGDGNEPDLWKDGGAGDSTGPQGEALDSPGLIGEPQTKRKSSTLLPLVLLAVLGVIGGAAAASRMGMRLPWVTNIPVIGPFLTPSDAKVEQAPSAVEEASSSSDSSETPVAAEEAPVISEDSSEEDAQPALEGEGNADSNSPAPSESSSDNSDADNSDADEASAIAETPFRDGVNAATKAAGLAQIAISSEDWNTVAEHWSDAVESMKVVPSAHPRYDVAQAKVSEYQRNLDYAQRLANP